MRLQDKQGKSFMAHVYCGDVSIDFSKRVIRALIGSGVNILELGIPFSDPVADGKVFQQACQRAILNGTKVDDVFKVANEFCDKIPIILTAYYNIVSKMGATKFVEKCKISGIKGIIVPDISYDESFPLLEECKKCGINLIYLVTPTTNDARLKKILSVASGFVYLVSFSGVTGIEKKIDDKIKSTIKKIKAIKDIPVFVGFGIKNESDVANILNLGADGVIVGSQICRLYQDDKRLDKVKEFALAVSKMCRLTK